LPSIFAPLFPDSGKRLVLADALAMGRLIREKRFATEVEAGKILCVIVSLGVCRWRRSTRWRKGHDWRASDDSDALGGKRSSPR
jgi:hypothetical protein